MSPDPDRSNVVDIRSRTRPNPDALLDGATLAAVLKIPAGTIRRWAHDYADELPRRGRDHAGRTLYRYGDFCALVIKLRTPPTNRRAA